MSWWFQPAVLLRYLYASCFFSSAAAFSTYSRHATFITATPPRQRPWSTGNNVWNLKSSTAGQGGGIFYDGASEFGTSPQPDIQSKQSNSNLSHKTTTTTPSSQLVAKPNQQTKDIVIIGGGLAGLAAALYVSQMAPHRQVTIVEKRVESPVQNTTVASFAAAGMLAPQSERLPKGPLLDLCVASRQLYPDFVDLVETLAQDEECKQYLFSDDAEKPWSVGYMASGGFLAPAFAGDAVATWAPPDEAGTARWLDATQVRELEPNLHPNVVGGWWFPEDASVDARRLTCSLRAACVAAGVILQQGEVTSLDLNNGTCRGVRLASGKYIRTASVLVANGAWMRTLLPVPIEPHKGQSLSLRMPLDQPPLLKRVLFAQDSYIVPKADGRIVIGATVEAGSYDPNVTPAGIIHCLSHALQLVPGLADLPLEETWVGLRPTTPDKGPILGKTMWDNLFLAGGYWRNGVLLAPKTGQLLASLLADLEISPEDQALLDAFGWDRFVSAEGGAKLAVDARYAASMHPIHKRTSGAGVAAAVGTELGVYSDARTAKQERERDRNALWQSGEDDDALERAARLGVQDAAAFQHDDKIDEEVKELWKETGEFTKEDEGEVVPSEDGESPQNGNSLKSLNPAVTRPFEGSPDAITVHSSTMESAKSVESKGSEQAAEKEKQSSSSESNLASVYEKIQKNKAASRENIEMSKGATEEKPDPGFRIYHVDAETGESRMVPPYTSPLEFQQMIAKEKGQTKDTDEAAPTEKAETESAGDSIMDGYQAIQDAHAGETADETAESFRKARMSARMNVDSVDVDLDGPNLDTEELPQKTPEPQQGKVASKNKDDKKYPDLSNIYERIKTNKEKQEVEMGESQPDERPDPGFRIYRVDPETREHQMVPPYTSPEEMAKLVAAEKQQHTVEETLTGDGEVLNVEPTELSSNGKTKPEEEYNEQTYDGYTDIQQANSRESRQEELEAMRASRRKNRIGASEIDITDIGAQRSDEQS